MISGEKILITGASGLVGLQFAKALAKNNEVWGVSRFARPEQRIGEQNAWAVDRSEVDKLGVKTIAADLMGDLDAIPKDFTYVLNTVHTRLGMDRQTEAMNINSLTVGRVLEHCRGAKAALVMSSTSVYASPATIHTPMKETDALGQGATGAGNPTSAAAKIALEAVSRYCALIFNLPVVITRLNVPYGPESGWCIRDMDDVVAGKEISHILKDPWINSPIHFDDMMDQLPALLDAASTNANVVNWGGDEEINRADWIRRTGGWAGRTPKMVISPGAVGNISDPTKRRSITGPCKRPFWDSFLKIYKLRHGEPAKHD